MVSMPSALASRGRSDRHRRAGDPDLAGIGGVDAGQDLDQGRLAGAVVAEEAEDLAGLQVEADILHRMDAAEGDANVPHLRAACAAATGH